MPRLNTFACKVCGTLKRDVNRWWILIGIFDEPGPLALVGRDPIETEKGGVVIMEFSLPGWEHCEREADRADSPATLELACGEDHALQLASRWMITRSFEPPSQRPLSPAPSAAASNTGLQPVASPSPAPLPEQENGK